MKPLLDQFCVVTATTDLDRSKACRDSWEAKATYRWPVYTVKNGGAGGSSYLGTVPAFAQGVKLALAAGHEIIACLHDDLLIEQDGWDHAVALRFINGPQVGLVGFLGGTGLGDSDLYEKPYSPHSLARSGVVSNERNAEAHGQRVRTPQRVAVLDGFSQIGRAAYWRGLRASYEAGYLAGLDPHSPIPGSNLYQTMAAWGITHHAYDAALGAFAARLGWEVWMLPVACHHLGGQTAVGDAGYSEWAKTIVPGGDQDFWELAHDICYREFKDVLPHQGEVMPRFKNSDINLPEKEGNTRSWDSIKVGMLMDLRDELQQLNAVFACQNFQSIPRELRAIKRELATIRKTLVTKDART